MSFLCCFWNVDSTRSNKDDEYQHLLSPPKNSETSSNVFRERKKKSSKEKFIEEIKYENIGELEIDDSVLEANKKNQVDRKMPSNRELDSDDSKSKNSKIEEKTIKNNRYKKVEDPINEREKDAEGKPTTETNNSNITKDANELILKEEKNTVKVSKDEIPVVTEDAFIENEKIEEKRNEEMIVNYIEIEKKEEEDVNLKNETNVKIFQIRNDEYESQNYSLTDNTITKDKNEMKFNKMQFNEKEMSKDPLLKIQNGEPITLTGTNQNTNSKFISDQKLTSDTFNCEQGNQKREEMNDLTSLPNVSNLPNTLEAPQVMPEATLSSPKRRRFHIRTPTDEELEKIVAKLSQAPPKKYKPTPVKCGIVSQLKLEQLASQNTENKQGEDVKLSPNKPKLAIATPRNPPKTSPRQREIIQEAKSIEILNAKPKENVNHAIQFPKTPPNAIRRNFGRFAIRTPTDNEIFDIRQIIKEEKKKLTNSNNNTKIIGLDKYSEIRGIKFLQINEKTPNQVRFMTFNIRYLTSEMIEGEENHWKKRREAVARIILYRKADVVALQEATYSQVMDINKILNNLQKRRNEKLEYAWIGYGQYFNPKTGQYNGEYLPIFYNTNTIELLEHSGFWLSETPDERGSKSWDAIAARVCTFAKMRHKITKKGFYVFNTHWDQGREARKNGAKLMREMIKKYDDLPCMVMGDLNCSPNSESYEILVDNFLVNVLPKKDILTPTFTGFENLFARTVDYILTTQNTKVGQAVVLTDVMTNEKKPSTHQPVLADVEFT